MSGDKNLKKNFLLIFIIFIILGEFFLFLKFIEAATNIDSTYYWAWSDVIGWLDFYHTNSVMVTNSDIEGWASSSVGVISLNCNSTPLGNICNTSTNGNYGISNNGGGTLTGWAWNDNIGWISVSCQNQGSAWCNNTSSYAVSIDPQGKFQGWAWNDSAGWISFNCGTINYNWCSTSNYWVQTTWIPSVTYGILDSSTFDTGAANGAKFNSIIWQGSLGTSSASVQFQIAISNSTSGPWSFVGPSGTSTYYQAAPNVPMVLSYSLNAGRYFRYRVYLNSDYGHTASPKANKIIVNWSP